MSARVPGELVEFRVLGPFEAAGATTPSQLRGRKERAVLAALVLAAGEVWAPIA
jgi:DNA-binding SARP family transcriptional activator